MTVSGALQELKNGVINGVRGPGCAAILLTDGRRLYAVDMHDDRVFEIDENGREGPAISADQVSTNAEGVTWTCDESGALYM